MLITPNGLLKAGAVVKVVAPPKPRERNKDEEPETGPEIRWVKRHEWDQFGFNERTVGEAKYLFAVACGLYRQADAAREGKEPPDAEYLLQEQERMAEAVLIGIDERLIEFDDE